MFLHTFFLTSTVVIQTFKQGAHVMICQKLVLFLEAMSVLVSSSWLSLKTYGFCNTVYGVTALCGSVAQIAVLVLFEESRFLLVLRGAVVAVVR